VALVVLLTAAGCGGSSSADTTPSSAAAAHGCPPSWRPGWQKWANKVQMPVYCPGWMPTVTGQIKSQWNTAYAPGHDNWQLGFAWLEFDNLVHIIFEGYAPKAFPPNCEGSPCFAGYIGSQQVGRFHVRWYDHNLASHTGHIAAIFRANGYIYVVSMHIAPPSTTLTRTKADVVHILKTLTKIDPQSSTSS
jgi:hypothetical protein